MKKKIMHKNVGVATTSPLVARGLVKTESIGSEGQDRLHVTRFKGQEGRQSDGYSSWCLELGSVERTKEKERNHDRIYRGGLF